jgi:protoporphyrinogen oxidase
MIADEAAGAPMKKAILIGAGPGGLTAAYELASRTTIEPVVLEKSGYMGGISRTVNYRGNRIDIGGHRFFSKSDRVLNWWREILPIEYAAEAGDIDITYHNRHHSFRAADGVDPSKTDEVMLVRNRKSRIYFQGKFYDYPISLSGLTLKNLGLVQIIRIGVSYAKSLVLPGRKEKSLEDFLINRFGDYLYRLFFKSYTEKVWGVKCNKISAEWGAQRIKGLSIWKALKHALKRPKRGGISQKGCETSLIERFLYPKFGPGQMWETVARRLREKGVQVLPGWTVVRVRHARNRIVEVEARKAGSEELRRFEGEYFFSTMPIKELVGVMEPSPPARVRELAGGLIYRDFLTVGLLCRKLRINNPEGRSGATVPDNWIYIQDHGVKVGRLQIFNNWSPYMVADQNSCWIGLEYFCDQGDSLWNSADEELVQLAKREMKELGIVDPGDVLDATVVRMEKAYPAYFGTYQDFGEIREYLDGFGNLFLIGRNGMHKYNNQDHSMLTAMTAVDNIIAGVEDKANIWAVNTEQDYHEQKEEREVSGGKMIPLSHTSSSGAA